ncbi:hypothetical protein ATZ36_07080 [Candidatus Endomicrobiellum trichonymphae]|uniref:Uncharacterized protein n=1 Tax=Endomicrobium trichonymphae TaxID=1408204 RepID=A0A1E5IHD7_ENDTX|nr:hypothetical protein ATZ36_07080 [Candidatus Endomicrobium trichonymphae]
MFVVSKYFDLKYRNVLRLFLARMRNETDKKSLKFKMKQTVFSSINFNKIASDPDFKEDSVREVIIFAYT